MTHQHKPTFQKETETNGLSFLSLSILFKREQVQPLPFVQSFSKLRLYFTLSFPLFYTLTKHEVIGL